MEVTHSHCAGLDVHKKTVVACCLSPGEGGELVKETRTFSTMTQDLLNLGDWLLHKGITHVAMESTGEYWKPVYNLLEDGFTVLVVNAQHIKNVPGRKTDVKDAEWIADLLRHGLLRGSFFPPLPQRDLRDLTRQRTKLVQERASVVNRLQKVLEWANLKLASVATDVTGVSSRKMLCAIAAGTEDVKELVELAKGSLRRKRQELPGNHESAGKRHSGRTGQGNNWLRSGLIQAAHAAVRCKDTYLKAVYQRLVKRRGKHKAIVAVAHRMREGGLPHLVETAGLPRLGS